MWDELFFYINITTHEVALLIQCRDNVIADLQRPIDSLVDFGRCKIASINKPIKRSARVMTDGSQR